LTKFIGQSFGSFLFHILNLYTLWFEL